MYIGAGRDRQVQIGTGGRRRFREVKRGAMKCGEVFGDVKKCWEM